MLILADADGFGLDLDQLSERILQTPRNRHRAAQAHVELGKFRGGEGRRRIDRRARFADDDLVHFSLRHLRGDQFDHFDGKLVRLPAGRAIADGNQFDVVLHDHTRQRRQRALPVIARLVRIDCRRLEQFAGGIDHRDFATGANTGIETEHRLWTGRRGQQ